MLSDQSLGELFATIGFKVDLTGINKARAAMKSLEAQAKATGKAMQAAMKNLGGGNLGNAAKSLAVAQQAQNKAQFQAQLQDAKLAKINNSSNASGLKTQQQQVALQIKQAQLAAVTQKSAAAAAKASLQQHAQALGHQIQNSRLANLQQQNQIRAARQAAQQHAAIRRAQGLTNSHTAGPRSAHGGGLLGIGNGALHRFGGVGRFAGGVTGGAEGALGGLEGLAGGLGGAAAGLGAIAGSAALVVAAFAAVAAAATGFAREAERAANTKNQRLGQFESVGDKTPENAARMNNRFENFAQIEGLSTQDAGESYAKLTNALSSKIGVDKAADATEGFMRFGVAQHLSNEDLKRSSLGVRQAFGFGQLKAQETNQILEPLGAHGMEYAAEAWQRAKGGKLTGDAASKEFLTDRQDRKISGDMLTKWFTSFSEVLNSHANDGGLLDKARKTQQAGDNRIKNQYNSNMSAAFDNTGLHSTMPALYDSFVDFLLAIEPQFEALGRSSDTVLTAVTGLVKGMTSLANWFNSGKSYLDPKFAQDFSNALNELGTSFSTLWHTIKQTFGIAEEAGVFKTAGETLVGVITAVVDVITVFTDAIIFMMRTLQDGLHALPTAVGGISDDDYAKITKQRQVDDKKRADIVARRELDRNGGGPMPGVTGNVDTTAPWRVTDGSDIPTAPTSQWRVTDGSDIPKVAAFPATVGATPKTPLVQPAVNGQAAASAVNNNVTNTITLNQAPITINGVDTQEIKGALEDHRVATERTMQDMVNKLSPATAAATQSQARGN